MRVRRRRKKGTSRRPVVGRNCRFLSYEGGKPVCGLRGDGCEKSQSCGYEEDGRTVARLMEDL